MKNKYTISEIRPRIFFLKFKRHYDLCMQFVRYQEFYESPSPRFRGKQFELLDYMEWYAHKYGKGVFTYTEDWSGFNCPGNIIKQVWDLNISDRNLYDYEMLSLYRKFLEKYPDGKFYVIGACEDADATMKHEVAHGFFFTQPAYKKAMTKLVKRLNKTLYKNMCKWLKEKGYTPKVYVDECQAYLSTGLPSILEIDLFKAKEDRQPFIDVFNKYFKK
jgi:hypothetical protein